MYILGINAYHGGASACLIKDGMLIAAVEEERFNRTKYWAGFPTHSIQYCLDEAGISAAELDHIGISRNPSANLMQKVLFTMRKRPNFGFVRDRLSNTLKVQDLKTVFSEALGLDANDITATFHNIEHHEAHLASAFLVSPYDEAAVLSVDGMGDFVSTMWGVGRDNKITIQGKIHFPNSLGWFYTAITQWLGFPKYGDEGKVMGLAPYGKPTYMDELRQIVRVQKDGTFDLDSDFFVNHAKGSLMMWRDGKPDMDTMYSPKLIELLGPAHKPGTEHSQHHLDVAASLQAVLEETELALVNMVQRKTGMKNLCMAGGVALNSAFNGKILPATDFEEIYVHPAAGDAGTSLGAAYSIYHQVLDAPRTYVLDHAYTGPCYSDEAILAELSGYGLHAEQLSDEALYQRVAQAIADGNVIGWFQGKMEWGPRALGNRSILADPRRSDMKDILNARIKYREPFRPFAPSILAESVGDFFDQTYPDPFMIKVYNVLPEKHDVIPAVTHVDGTGRLQTVHQETNPRYWNLIREFERLTGVPVVLNTSFNENEPIVCTPKEAIECYLRTKMDVLAIGNYFLAK